MADADSKPEMNEGEISTEIYMLQSLIFFLPAPAHEQESLCF
jgi:hypothetical protein